MIAKIMLRALSALTCITLFGLGASPGSANAQEHATQQPAPPPTAAPAQANATRARGDIAGDWQGTLQTGKSLRIVVKVAKTEKGWSARMYSIDQGGQPLNATSASLDGSTFKYSVDLIGGTFQGTVSADGNSIVGTWTQGPTPVPFTL